MIDVLQKDFMRASRAKGLSRIKTIIRHGIKNAAVPIITILCMQFPIYLSGTVVVESIFVWPGIGRLSYDAIIKQDFPLIMGITLFMAVLVIVMNLVSDIINMFVDKRQQNSVLSENKIKA